MRGAAAGIATALACAHAALGADLWLAGAEAPVAGDVIVISPQSVVFDSPVGERTEHAWADVWAVDTPEGVDIEPHLVAGREIRRAEARLDREDWHGALRALERVDVSYLNSPGITAARAHAVACVARVRLGLESSAVMPWLAWRSAADPESRDAINPALVDPALSVLIQAPPVWAPSDASRTDVLTASAADRLGTEVERVLASLYVLAAAACAPDPQSPGGQYESLRRAHARVINADPGAVLIADMVGALAGDASTRRAARERLRDRPKPDDPAWVRHWCALAIGRSLTLEPDPQQVRVGVARLIAVAVDEPVGQRGADPSLVRRALMSAADACEAVGDLDAAAALRRDLLSRFPDASLARSEPRGSLP